MYIYYRQRRGGAIAGEDDVKGKAKDFLIGIPGNYIAATASPLTSHKLRNIIRNIYYVYIFVERERGGKGAGERRRQGKLRRREVPIRATTARANGKL